MLIKSLIYGIHFSSQPLHLVLSIMVECKPYKFITHVWVDCWFMLIKSLIYGIHFSSQPLHLVLSIMVECKPYKFITRI